MTERSEKEQATRGSDQMMGDGGICVVVVAAVAGERFPVGAAVAAVVATYAEEHLQQRERMMGLEDQLCGQRQRRPGSSAIGIDGQLLGVGLWVCTDVRGKTEGRQNGQLQEAGLVVFGMLDSWVGVYLVALACNVMVPLAGQLGSQGTNLSQLS